MNDPFDPRRRGLWRHLAILLIAGGGGTFLHAQPTPERIHAPELRGADAWLNTDTPLTIKDLRGQVVLLDFWTYCCINCMHIFPDLKYLEEKYHDQPLVVIGVHSGKFSKEKDAAHIRQAILRHDIRHPVAVDSEFRIWNAYAVRAWPTLVLIDPEGMIVGFVSGEGHRDTLDREIGRLLTEHREKGTLGKPMRFRPERAGFEPGLLEFPGKVLADAPGKRLFISDTGHHRVLVTDLAGRVQATIGDGRPGLRDGTFESARFHQPQGLALSDDGRHLYVADTENHAIRDVDLRKRAVRTIAGTGKQTHDYRADGPATRTALSSPWDLARVGDRLYIAMAGTHQIWVLDLKEDRVRVLAGTGTEAGIDGPNDAAAFAQPSGLATDGARLFVADSEISSIRTVELGLGDETRTLAGRGGLFEFGDRDGAGWEARFQHPLGVALAGDTLLVADTFNDRLRRIDIERKRVTTWFGVAPAGIAAADGRALYEPGGLSVGGGTVYVADTNHHRIVAIDLTTRKARVLPVRLKEPR